MTSNLAKSQNFFYYRSMLISRLTGKAQTTIPKSVRTALGLRPGDALAYRIEGGRAVLTRAGTPPAQNPSTI